MTLRSVNLQGTADEKEQAVALLAHLGLIDATTVNEQRCDGRLLIRYETIDVSAARLTSMLGYASNAQV